MIKLIDVARLLKCDVTNLRRWITNNHKEIPLSCHRLQGVKTWMLSNLTDTSKVVELYKNRNISAPISTFAIARVLQPLKTGDTIEDAFGEKFILRKE